MWRYVTTEELYHHGIPGMKWGVRRFQNEDGSLTAAGEKRYGSSENNKQEKAKERSTAKTDRSPTTKVEKRNERIVANKQDKAKGHKVIKTNDSASRGKYLAEHTPGAFTTTGAKRIQLGRAIVTDLSITAMANGINMLTGGKYRGIIATGFAAANAINYATALKNIYDIHKYEKSKK